MPAVKISNFDKSLKKLFSANDLVALKEKGLLLLIFLTFYLGNILTYNN